MEDEWYTNANTLEVKEDYFEYFEDQYENDIVKLLDDMLKEAGPIEFPSSNIGDYNYLVNEVWTTFLSTHSQKELLENKKTEFLFTICYNKPFQSLSINLHHVNLSKLYGMKNIIFLFLLLGSITASAQYNSSENKKHAIIVDVDIPLKLSM